MKTELFDYPLPERLIAQTPVARRDDSRLLVVHRATRRLEHRSFRDIAEYMQRGDVLFRNNAAVIPARIHAQRPTGGQVECLLLRPVSDLEWWCLIRPGRKLPVGGTFAVADAFTATVQEKNEEGIARVKFETGGESILAVAQRVGEMPLPPYIERDNANPKAKTGDRERYQTVYADRTRTVAAAAPTAGLHFTPELLARLAAAGVEFADLTLHVGLGTFRPISTENVEDHAIHREVYEIAVPTQQAAFKCKGRRVAVGTTSLRAIEDFHRRHAAPLKTNHFEEADIFIYPPAEFVATDALVTNFHQPRSTLLCLVSAFLSPGSTDGIAWMKEIYAEAVAREYRFFSYGDAMLIL